MSGSKGAPEVAMHRCGTLFLLILLSQLGSIPRAWGQGRNEPAPRTLRIDPLPAGAPVYRAGSKFQPNANRLRQAPVQHDRWNYSDPAGRSPIRPVSTAPTPSEFAPIPHESMPTAPIPMEFAPESYIDAGCDSCGPDALFGCRPPTQWSAGIELTFVKPYMENNPAFTLMESDGATFETFSDVNFEYDRELAPRVWIEAIQCESLGLRAVYWQYDYSARTESGSPPANGFGRLSPPTFGAIDLSTTVPTSRYNAFTDLNAYSIDLEATRSFQTRTANWLATAGLRFAESRQRYVGNLLNGSGVQQGSANYSNLVQGIGPTLSVRTQRPFAPQLALFGMARGSLVFGDGKTELLAVEDQDLNTRLTTQSSSLRDDLLPIGEVQVGLQWTPPCPGIWHPYLHLALEGQHWGGVGNGSSTEGDLGFFGFNVALGVDW